MARLGPGNSGSEKQPVAISRITTDSDYRWRASLCCLTQPEGSRAVHPGRLSRSFTIRADEQCKGVAEHLRGVISSDRFELIAFLQKPGVFLHCPVMAKPLEQVGKHPIVTQTA